LDATIRPAEEGRRLAKEAAETLGLDEHWFDDGIRAFLSEHGTFAPLEIADMEAAARRHLRIVRASASYLLAMKCMACRPALPGYPGDRQDLAFLIRNMGLKSVEEVAAQVDRYYPFDGLSSKARVVVEDILAEQS
jgi:hypothetical protein